MAKDQALKKDLDKKQIITVVALFAVLIAVFYFFVLSGGDEPEDLGAVPVTEPTVVPGTEPTPEATESPDPEETDDPGNDPPTNTSRDPFDPPPGAVDNAGNPFESSQPVDPAPEETPDPEATPTPEPTPTPSP